MNVPGLRSPFHKTGGLFYFGRMLDKIRLHAKGELPADYQPNLGKGFDARCLAFLGIDYAALRDRVLAGGSDEEILEWCRANGTPRSAEDVALLNAFLRKFGWNDEASATLKRRLAEGGFTHRHDIQTIFDYIDLDEGRDPANRTSNPWE